MEEADANGLRKYAIINGQNALHQGIELDVQAKPVKNLSVTGMVSIGDWKWKNDVEATITDDAGNIEKTITTYAAGLHVGDAAQTTMALMADYTFLNRFTAGFTYNYFDRLYASFDPSRRTDPGIRTDAWRLPSYQTLDLNLRYNIKVLGVNATLYGNVNNLLNEIFISDAVDGSDHNAETSYVYYSYGRTWNTGLRVRF
jgi:iron complex outermembrane receptor protein